MWLSRGSSRDNAASPSLLPSRSRSGAMLFVSLLARWPARPICSGGRARPQRRRGSRLRRRAGIDGVEPLLEEGREVARLAARTSGAGRIRSTRPSTRWKARSSCRRADPSRARRGTRSATSRSVASAADPAGSVIGFGKAQAAPAGSGPRPMATTAPAYCRAPDRDAAPASRRNGWASASRGIA